MPADITMPQLSDTMTEGTLVKWLKQEGDKVKAGEVVAEVETDKATMEMESFESGTLATILVKEGEKAPVGGTIAVLAKAGENAADVRKNAGRGATGKAAAGAKAAETGTPTGSTGAGEAGASAGRGSAGQASPRRGSTGAGSAEPNSAGGAMASGATVGDRATSGQAGAKSASSADSPRLTAKQTPQKQPPFDKKPSRAPENRPGNYNFDLIVIGGGPAGYAAAIRAGQLKKRVLCIEKENLGGTCLNWGCIPTKALLESGAFVRKLREDASKWGVSFDNLQVDFPKTIGRSRDIAGKLSKGIAHLFSKYTVKSVMGTAIVTAPHKVSVHGKDGQKEFTGQNILVATGARSRDLPNIKADGKKIITSREAMTLPALPKRMAIIGAGAIGCEFGDFYSSMGTQVTIIEMLDHLLPIEDEDVSILLERSFAKRGIKVHTKTRTEAVDTAGDGVKLMITTPKGSETVEADVCLLAVGVTGNIEGLFGKDAPVEIFKNHVKVDPNEYQTNVEGVWAVGDVIGPPWLAHVAHHEAVYCVEKMFGVSDHSINYGMIPGCTYTHPQVASIGLTEKKAREQGKEIKVGKFPFAASGRAVAAGETEGFVKLIFGKQYGELIGAHMVGEHVTELLSELVVAQRLEATESEIIEAMHPHPTLSEAVMEAAGVADGRAIHL